MVNLANAAVFLDFDGTITESDVGVHLLERLGDPDWRQVEDLYFSGAIGSRECLEREWALLPRDEHPDVSAVLYQNLAPVIGPIAQQLSPSQLQSLRQLAAETKPSVVCAYGEDNTIRVATSSRLFGFDLNTLTLSTLLRVARPGHNTLHR